ncbi:hypothetical protein IT417_02300 [bacterium]|nr:hypothetical protein [bacterium]
MKHQQLTKTYEGLGFIEALLAIVVAGMASVLLMGVAADTVKQVVINELGDSMTQIAIEGGSAVKTIAEKNNNSEEKLFPSITTNVNNCFAVSGTAGNPEFVNTSGVFIPACNYDAGERNSCKNAVSSSDPTVFNVFCITPESDIATGLVVGKMVVGKIGCDNSDDCEVSDYEYYVLTKTLQK